jgi:hypothetical protein
MKWNAGMALASVLFVAAGLVASAQSAPDFSKTANPELVGSLAKEMGATPQQAEGAAGALFGAAKAKMPAGDWSKLSAEWTGCSRPRRPWAVAPRVLLALRPPQLEPWVEVSVARPPPSRSSD